MNASATGVAAHEDGEGEDQRRRHAKITAGEPAARTRSSGAAAAWSASRPSEQRADAAELGGGAGGDTTPAPLPAATSVPEKAIELRSPSGASAATGRGLSRPDQFPGQRGLVDPQAACPHQAIFSAPLNDASLNDLSNLPPRS